MGASHPSSLAPPIAPLPQVAPCFQPRIRVLQQRNMNEQAKPALYHLEAKPGHPHHLQPSRVAAPLPTVLSGGGCVPTDCDGVVNQINFYTGFGDPNGAIDATCVERIAAICEKLGGAKVCISSSWRSDERRLSGIMRALSLAGVEVEGVTMLPAIVPNANTEKDHAMARAAEVNQYLSSRSADKVIILDDLPLSEFLDDRYKPCFLRTQRDQGLSSSDVARVSPDGLVSDRKLAQGTLFQRRTSDVPEDSTLKYPRFRAYDLGRDGRFEEVRTRAVNYLAKGSSIPPQAMMSFRGHSTFNVFDKDMESKEEAPVVATVVDGAQPDETFLLCEEQCVEDMVAMPVLCMGSIADTQWAALKPVQGGMQISKTLAIHGSTVQGTAKAAEWMCIMLLASFAIETRSNAAEGSGDVGAGGAQPRATDPATALEAWCTAESVRKDGLKTAVASAAASTAQALGFETAMGVFNADTVTLSEKLDKYISRDRSNASNFFDGINLGAVYDELRKMTGNKRNKEAALGHLAANPEVDGRFRALYKADALRVAKEWSVVSK